MRRFTPLLCFLLSACSSIWADTSAAPPAALPAAAPSQEALQKIITNVAKEAKLAGPVEMSAVRQTDHGPGDYFVCLREANAVPNAPRLTYSVFFDGDAYKGSRQSVILEACERQQYAPANLLPAAHK